MTKSPFENTTVWAIVTLARTRTKPYNGETWRGTTQEPLKLQTYLSNYGSNSEERQRRQHTKVEGN
ncbi:hypothetical protein E5D57_005636 [Metarhizium anisopliae]|nr:hypothetical protein E5D57_005636 [Metarhizium anisopliae]